MRTRIKLVLTTTLLLLVSSVARIAFHMMNYPADPVFYGGVLLILGLFMVLPTLLFSIWRPKKVDINEKAPTA